MTAAAGVFSWPLQPDSTNWHTGKISTRVPVPSRPASLNRACCLPNPGMFQLVLEGKRCAAIIIMMDLHLSQAGGGAKSYLRILIESKMDLTCCCGVCSIP